MRFLLTCTKSYRGYHSSYDSLRASDSGTTAIVEALLAGGHDVEIRPVDPGECLDEYDCLIVTMINSMVQGTHDLYGCLWCLAQEWTGGPPAVVNFDHWDLKGNIKSYARLHNEPHRLFDGFIEYKKKDRALRQESILRMQCQRLAEGFWPPSVTCAWGWGDHSKLNEDVEQWIDGFAMTYDPSYLHVEHFDRLRLDPHFTRTVRSPHWVLGSISMHERWIDKQGLTWPIEFYGLPKKGWPFLSRDNLLVKYTEVGGALSPPYYSVGSGYWRARLVHYALAGCVTLADPKELGPLGEHFRVGGDWVEKMTDNQRRELAAQQYTSFMRGCQSKRECTETILDYFETTAELHHKNNELTSRPSFEDPMPLQERLI